MSYYIYQLKFDSPVHFGQAELGGNLEKIAWIIHPIHYLVLFAVNWHRKVSSIF